MGKSQLIKFASNISSKSYFIDARQDNSL